MVKATPFVMVPLLSPIRMPPGFVREVVLVLATTGSVVPQLITIQVFAIDGVRVTELPGLELPF